MPVATANEFFNALEKSRLVSPEQIEQLREAVGDAADGKATAIRLVKDRVLTRWQAGALLAGNVNLTIGKYHLLNQIGSGKTGRVYLGRHVDMGRQVALKILPRRADASATNLQHFMKQARAVSALDHPNLIHTYDVDSEADQFYLVMEYFPGDDLQTLVEKQGPVECGRAVEIIRQAAEGLAHAVEMGMTHGDIRPNSIAVDAQGRVKVLHLGLFELAGPSLRTLDENDPTSADYAAPEYQGGEATPLCDVYSLGCVFYFLLTGVPPFGEGSFADRRRQHQSQPPVALTKRRPEIPADLARICHKMMAKTPSNRVPSVADVAALLEAWLQANPDLAPTQPTAPSDNKSRTSELPSTAAAPSSPASSGPIPAFDLGQKRTTKPAKTVAVAPTTEAPTETASDASPAGEASVVERRKPINKGLLIGVGVGGGIALLALVGLAVFLIFGGDENEGEQIAQAPAQQTAANEPEVIDGVVLDEETLDGDLFSSDDSDAETAPSDDVSGDSMAAATEAATVSPTAAESTNVALAANTADAPASPEASATAETLAAAEPQPPAPSEESSSPPAEPPATDSAPAVESAPSDPAPAQPPAAAPKPKEPEKKKPPEPFSDFKATALNLPPLADGADAGAIQPVTLAVIHDDPDAGCFLRLNGGDTAHQGKEVFTLEPDEQGYRNRAWTIFLGQGATGETNRTPIAKLALDDKDNLTFQWTPQAAAQRAANYLRNCSLNISIGDKSKETLLREPTVVEPLVISLDKGGMRAQLDVDWAPDPDQLQLEITSLEGPFPKHTFDPAAALKAAGGRTLVMFGEPPNQFMMLEVRATMSRKLGITVTPYLKLGNQPVRMTMQSVQQAFAQATALYQQANNLVTQKVGPAQQRDALEKQLPQLAAEMQGYGEIAEKASVLNNTGKIHFRLFFIVGQRQVDVLKSSAAPVRVNPAGNPTEG